MEKIVIHTKKEYPLYISKGIISQAGSLLKKSISPCRAGIIADERVPGAIKEALVSSLEAEGFSPFVFPFEAREENKNLSCVETILNFLSHNDFQRSDLVISLGGGITGDIAGLTASLYLRGISFAQIPTTLLAAVDSSVGGKAAVNLKSGKNLAGSFIQPIAVLCDTDILDALPQRLTDDAMGEIIKCALLSGGRLKELIGENNLNKNSEEIIALCVKIKGQYVEEDEFDTSKRHFLNLGHTFAHAIEKKSNYSISHGRAVALGLLLAAELSFNLGLCEKSLIEDLKEIYALLGLSAHCPYKISELYEFMLKDKKRKGEDIIFVLIKDWGSCVLRGVKIDELKKMGGEKLL